MRSNHILAWIKETDNCGPNKFLFQKYRLISSNKSSCESSAIIAYLEIHKESKLIFQEDKIIQHCRQLPPKGRNDLQ